MTDRLAYRVPEVCAMLGISPATLYRRAQRGEIAIYKIRSCSLIKREDVEALLALPKPAPAPKPAEVMDGLVYFIDDGFFIKIGFSKDPEDRMIKLQTASPFKLRLLHSIVANRRLEREFHQKFRHLKSHGEWFRGESELRAYIAGLSR